MVPAEWDGWCCRAATGCGGVCGHSTPKRQLLHDGWARRVALALAINTMSPHVHTTVGCSPPTSGCVRYGPRPSRAALLACGIMDHGSWPLLAAPYQRDAPHLGRRRARVSDVGRLPCEEHGGAARSLERRRSTPRRAICARQPGAAAGPRGSAHATPWYMHMHVPLYVLPHTAKLLELGSDEPRLIENLPMDLREDLPDSSVTSTVTSA